MQERCTFSAKMIVTIFCFNPLLVQKWCNFREEIGLVEGSSISNALAVLFWAIIMIELLPFAIITVVFQYKDAVLPV